MNKNVSFKIEDKEFNNLINGKLRIKGSEASLKHFREILLRKDEKIFEKTDIFKDNFVGSFVLAKFDTKLKTDIKTLEIENFINKPRNGSIIKSLNVVVDGSIKPIYEVGKNDVYEIENELGNCYTIRDMFNNVIADVFIPVIVLYN